MDFEKIKAQAAEKLKNGDAKGAEALYDLIISGCKTEQAEHLADAHFGKLMIEKEVKTEHELRVRCLDGLISIKDSPNFKEAYKHADSEFRFFLYDLSQQIEDVIKKNEHKVKLEEHIYHDTGVEERLQADRERQKELARRRALGEEMARELRRKNDEAKLRKHRNMLLGFIGLAAVVCVVVIGVPTMRYSDAMKAVRHIESGKTQGAAVQRLMSIDGYKDSGDILATFFYNPVAVGNAHSIMMKTASTSASASVGNPRTAVAREAIGGFFDVIDAVDAAGSGDLSKLEAFGNRQTGAEDTDTEVFGAEDTESGAKIKNVSSDGKVAAVGDNAEGQCQLGRFSDIVSLAAGAEHTVGLKKDGTAVASGSNRYGQCDTTSWTNIVSIAAGGYVTVGVRKDGTAVAAGQDLYYQTDLSEWKKIVAAATGGNHTVGLKKGGTVVAVGSDSKGQTDLSKWKNIVAVAAGENHTIGLRADGTVVAAGDNSKQQCDVSQWTNITAVAAAGDFTAGLKYDGTLVVTGDDSKNQLNLKMLKGTAPVVAVAAGRNNLLVMREDGTYEALGDNSQGQLLVN
ncbi:hypothetical protein FACS1894120_5510 [Clostridia bacterium]|nr:hypothetical protein FACS1894120_5510 [Clostridia bacterium]